MRPDIIMLVLAIVGLASSLLAVRDYYSGTPVCRVDERWNCKAVYSIPEAEFLGIHLTFLAPIYFAAMLVLTLVYLVVGTRTVLACCTALSLGGLVLVPYLVYLEAYVAHAFCLHCTIMHVVIALYTVSGLYAYTH